MTYEVAARRLMKRFARVPLEAVAIPQVCELVTEIHEDAGPAAANLALSVGRMTYKFAALQGWRGTNPFLQVPKFRTANRRFPTSPGDVSRAVDICADCFHERIKKPLSPVLAAYFPVVALTGMRRSEVTHLRWAEIDFAAQVATLQVHKTSSKTGAKTIHLPDPATFWLKEIRARAWSPVFVFPSKRSKRGHIEDPWRAWKRLCKAANIPGETRIHDLRHGFAAAAYAASGDLKVVQGLLGHASIATTSRYVGSAPSTRARPVADAVAARLLGKGDGE